MSHDQRLQQARRDQLREHLLAPVMSLAGFSEMLSEWLKARALDGWDSELANIEHSIEQLQTWVGELEQAVVDKADTEASTRIRHDMRNALGAVSGYAELILEELEDDDSLDASGRTCLERLIRESQNLLASMDRATGAAGAGEHEAEELGDLAGILESLSASASEDDEDIRGGRILIVDDNESNRVLLGHRIEQQGHVARTAESGRIALDMMADEPPDLVLLDLMMPDMNGFEVLRVMHETDELRNIPVIVVTGLNDHEGAVRCIEAGAQDYLTKPVNPVLLQARMRACLERKRWHDKENQYKRELERSYAFVRKVFGRYLSDEVVDRLLDADDGLKVGGDLQKVTIMMTDLRGFTELSQGLDPVDVVSLLNIYLEEMSSVIVRYNGTIDEIIGDALLVLFGAPFAAEDDAQRAIACALDMQLAMVRVNQAARARGLPAVEMGIGINTGDVVVGNIGSELRSKYAVVGHHVNLTGRIESFTVGNQVLASEFTVAEVGDLVRVGRQFDVDAKGLREPITLFEILGIGDPFNLDIGQQAEPLETLASPVKVEFVELADKKLDGPRTSGRLEALAEDRAVLDSDRPLELMANLRLNLESGGPVAESDFYAKVTECTQEHNGERYQVTFTSMPNAVREHLAARRSQSDMNVHAEDTADRRQ